MQTYGAGCFTLQFCCAGTMKCIKSVCRYWYHEGTRPLVAKRLASVAGTIAWTVDIFYCHAWRDICGRLPCRYSSMSLYRLPSSVTMRRVHGYCLLKAFKTDVK